MHRVLRPSGVIGIRECDWGERLHLPMTAVLENWYTITVKVRQHNGGDPFMGRHNALLLRNAGFVEIEVSEAVWKAETPEEVENCTVFLKAQLQGFSMYFPTARRV